VGALVEEDHTEEENALGEAVEETRDAAETGGMTELELRRQELALRKYVLERQKEKDRTDQRLHELEMERQKMKEEADRKLREMKLDLRKLELDRQREKDKKEEEERERQKKKDEEEKTRRESLAGQTRFMVMH